MLHKRMNDIPNLGKKDVWWQRRQGKDKTRRGKKREPSEALVFRHFIVLLCSWVVGRVIFTSLHSTSVNSTTSLFTFSIHLLYSPSLFTFSIHLLYSPSLSIHHFHSRSIHLPACLFHLSIYLSIYLLAQLGASMHSVSTPKEGKQNPIKQIKQIESSDATRIKTDRSKAKQSKAVIICICVEKDHYYPPHVSFFLILILIFISSSSFFFFFFFSPSLLLTIRSRSSIPLPFSSPPLSSAREQSLSKTVTPELAILISIYPSPKPVNS
jgi:hypothetical protein